MAIDSSSLTSRRALITAGAGGLLALVAQALGRPLPARAANGDPLTAGNIVSASATTGATTSAGNGLQGTTSAAASGVYGESNTASGYGVAGRSYAGHGVLGITQAGPGYFGVWGKGFEDGIGGTGVWGEGGLNGTGILATGMVGIRAHADDPNFGYRAGLKAEGNTGGYGVDADTQAALPAIRAAANGDSTGVQGYSGPGSPPAAPTKTGVYGYAAQDANARGVTGQTTAGRGINGLATTGRGVHGQATSGTGVYATATTGTALRAVGPVRFSSAGLATIPSGSKSVTVNPGLDITGSSKVLTTLQTNPGGTTTIQRIARNTVANTFTIWLTANAAANTIVAWFLIS